MFQQSKRLKMNDESSTEMPSSSSVADGVVPEADNEEFLATGVPASVTIALHPLVIMNISDHYTRIKAQEGVVPKVYGALLGKQNGRNLELYNSFELQHSENAEGCVIEMEYFQNKEEQFRQVFSDLDFLGWYTVGSSSATEQDIKIQKQMITVNESSLLLKLDPLSKSSNLPITIYESMIDIIDQQPRMLFIKVQYTLVTEEAERIGVDHVARVSTAAQSEISQVSEYMQVQQSAIKMLSSRVDIILQYVSAVKDGHIPLDQSIMRQCLSLCQRLPVLNTKEFQGEFHEQCSDITLMSYLATITKGCSITNELISKFNVIYDKHGSSRRMRGLFF
ncbi:COP9 signalosome complex subunit 6-like [Clytia hemisphaerica]|uniref:COP9 signalosome complex subunit 6 n=1 Tax=Clytia hemisphaerica TaxID=252671 RepID=A0A7M5X8W5_9CNID|eukprot:TCONS_00045981-protein